MNMFVTAHGEAIVFTWFEWSVWKNVILIASFADCATRSELTSLFYALNMEVPIFLTQKNKFKSCSFQSLRH